MSEGQLCPQCMSHSLNHFSHNALLCKNVPDVVSHSNRQKRESTAVMMQNVKI